MDKKNHESLRLCSFNKISIVSFFNKFEKKKNFQLTVNGLYSNLDKNASMHKL